MEKLLNKDGEKIWEKLKSLAKDKDSTRRGTIWRNEEYRVDVGSKVRGTSTTREWHLQVNNEAKSATKQGLGARGTHEEKF